MEIFVARQPIFNTNQEVYAYELLYRDSDKNFFSGNVSADVATSILLMNSYFNFGLDSLIGKNKAFLNFEKELVMKDIPQLLDNQSVVIELLEDVVPDQLFMNKIKHLKQLGYTIAIDDFVDSYEYHELVDLCDIIKVEFLGESRQSIEKIVRTWKPRGKILLAEKVETREEYEWAKGIGFDLFQGYFFSRPALMQSKAMNENFTSYARLMEELNQQDPNFKRISSIIEMDVGLTYKLLKLVNSRFTQNTTIKSIQHALAILGVKALQKWVSLALVQEMSTSETQELIKTAMVRSNLLEIVADASTLRNHREELTLMGILSILDVITRKPMDVLMNELPVSQAIKNTLLGETSDYEQAYKICLNYELGDYNDIKRYSETIGYDSTQLSNHYLEAVKSADHLYDEVFA